MASRQAATPDDCEHCAGQCQPPRQGRQATAAPDQNPGDNLQHDSHDDRCQPDAQRRGQHGRSRRAIEHTQIPAAARQADGHARRGNQRQSPGRALARVLVDVSSPRASGQATIAAITGNTPPSQIPSRGHSSAGK